MNTRKINITFEIEDNDLIEMAFIKEVKEHFSNVIIKENDTRNSRNN